MAKYLRLRGGGRDNQEQWQHVIVFTLIIFGLATVTSIKPSIWYEPDLVLIGLLGGNWILIDGIYCISLSVLLLSLARKILNPSEWPLRWLLFWLPAGLWALLSSGWAMSASLVISTWYFEYLFGGVSAILGYAIARGRSTLADSCKFSVLVVIGYVAIRALLVKSSLDYTFTTTWFCLITPLLLGWMYKECESISVHRALLLFVLIALIQILMFLYIPQRMYYLSLIVSITFIGIFAFVAKIEPKRLYLWRGLLMSLLFMTGALAISLLASKPASGILLDNSPGYAVFYKSERFEIFRYWISYGTENFWTGAGLHWRNPLNYYADTPASVFLPQGMISHAHNYFINVWLQLGFIGLIAQFILFGSAFLYIARRFISADPNHRAIVLFYSGALVACFSRNLSDDGLRSGPLLLFWLITGMVIGLINRPRDQLESVLVKCVAMHPVFDGSTLLTVRQNQLKHVGAVSPAPTFAQPALPLETSGIQNTLWVCR